MRSANLSQIDRLIQVYNLPDEFHVIGHVTEQTKYLGSLKSTFYSQFAFISTPNMFLDFHSFTKLPRNIICEKIVPSKNNLRGITMGIGPIWRITVE